MISFTSDSINGTSRSSSPWINSTGERQLMMLATGDDLKANSLAKVDELTF
jgi:hypothetical protein